MKKYRGKYRFCLSEDTEEKNKIILEADKENQKFKIHKWEFSIMYIILGFLMQILLFHFAFNSEIFWLKMLLIVVISIIAISMILIPIDIFDHYHELELEHINKKLKDSGSYYRIVQK